MDILIRELYGRDLSKGLLETLTSLSDVSLTTEAALDVYRNRLRNGIRTYVALHQDRIVGTASLLVEQKFLHGGASCGHIEDVAVHRDFQKRGIGTSLVLHATERARELGCYKVILNCYERLIPFYERLGYKRHDSGLRIDLH